MCLCLAHGLPDLVHGGAQPADLGEDLHLRYRIMCLHIYIYIYIYIYT